MFYHIGLFFILPIWSGAYDSEVANVVEARQKAYYRWRGFALEYHLKVLQLQRTNLWLTNLIDGVMVCVG